MPSSFAHLGENVVREKEYLSAMVAYEVAVDVVSFGLESPTRYQELMAVVEVEFPGVNAWMQYIKSSSYDRSNTVCFVSILTT
jgi:hypothetical protein